MFREVIPFPQALDLELTLPGSKSITNRAFLCAALAKGKSVIRGALLSDDTNIMLNALRKLEIGNLATEGSCTGLRSNNLRKGVQSHSVVELRDDTVVIEGCGGQFTDKKLTLDLHNAGTAVRFLTAVMTIRKGETVITGNQRMQERPIGDLVEGLRQLGANIEYLGEEGYPPFKIQDSKFPPRRAGKIQDSRYVVKMKGDTSSQYFSALLMLAPLLDRLLQLEVIGDLVSKPYIDTTIAVMKAFGVKVQNDHYKSFLVKPQAYKACEFTVEGDASAASYFTSIHYLHEGKLKFTNLNTNFDQKMS
ncbi:hypothetical protein COY07_04775, partial [Candidatus Peregrinibacteria bacterium CG_4_10_14_0_2_um_filter_43_11]